MEDFNVPEQKSQKIFFLQVENLYFGVRCDSGTWTLRILAAPNPLRRRRLQLRQWHDCLFESEGFLGANLKHPPPLSEGGKEWRLYPTGGVDRGGAPVEPCGRGDRICESIPDVELPPMTMALPEIIPGLVEDQVISQDYPTVKRCVPIMVTTHGDRYGLSRPILHGFNYGCAPKSYGYAPKS